MFLVCEMSLMQRRKFLIAFGAAPLMTGCIGGGSNQEANDTQTKDSSWGLPICDNSNKNVKVKSAELRTHERINDDYEAIVKGAIENIGVDELAIEIWATIYKEGSKIEPGLISVNEEGEDIYYVLEAGETVSFFLHNFPNQEPDSFTLEIRTMSPSKAEMADIVQWQKAPKDGCE